jgi:putative phage-type endonuclease
MNREAWLKERQTGIGGSDAATACGLSPHRTPLELWLKKTGQMPPELADVPDSQRMHFGRILEATIAAEYARTQEVRLRRRNTQLRHPKHAFMVANVDRLIEGQRTGLEIKNVDLFAFKSGEWGADGSDEVPTDYLFQCAHYMAVLDYERWHLAALVGGNDLHVFTIERDRELEQMMIDSEAEFWRHVESREAPPLDYAHPSALRLVKQLYPGTDGTTIALDAEVAKWHAVREEAEAHLKQYKAVSDGARAHILDAMGNAAIGRFDDGSIYTRKTVQRKGYSVEPMEYIDCRFKKAKD